MAGQMIEFQSNGGTAEGYLSLPEGGRGPVEYLVNHEATEGPSVGAVGFCMGGQLSLYAASKNEQIGACVVFYGIHPNVKPDLANLQAPVHGLYEEADQFVPPD